MKQAVSWLAETTTDFDRPKAPSGWVYLLLGIGSLVLFVIDVMTPLGYADWIMYFIPVLLTAFLRTSSAPVVVATVATLLNLAGYVLSPRGDFVGAETADAANALVNRGFGIVVYWAVALIGRAYVQQRERLQLKNWVRAVQAEVTASMRGDISVETLCEQALSVLTRRLKAPVAAVYVLDESGELVLAASIGLAGGAPPARIAVGETVVGEVAKQQTRIMIVDAPPDYLHVRSATGSHGPTSVIVQPAIIDDELYGVFEIGWVRPLEDAEIAAMDFIGESIAAALRAAKGRARIDTLLQQSQRQASELQAQQEELRASNEELESQAAAVLEAQRELEQRQAQLHETNADLERQRASAIEAREQLRVRALELTASNRFKSEFLANVSHELRTPLNSTLIMARLLADNKPGNLSEQQIQYAETIYNAGKDLLVLINDILDLSKIEAGRIDLRIGSVTLAELVDAMKQLFDHVASARGLSFEVEVEPSAPSSLQTDATRVSQILKNILANAFKFTERGGVVLRLEASTREGTALGGSANGIALSVTDTGIGIPEDRLQGIFEQFSQADGSISRRFGGTGLGLSISRQLASLLGGTIEVSSREHVGSTFTLWLPSIPPKVLAEGSRGLKAASEPPALLPAEAVSVPAVSAPPVAPVQHPVVVPPAAGTSGRRVLIVEDDGGFATTMVALAREHGFEATVAGTAAEALRLVAEHPVDGVILDLRLPDASGLSVLAHLKRSPSLRHIPVHALSAFEDDERASRMGAIGYMRKPVGPAEIAEVFERLRQSASQESARVLVIEDDEVQRRAIVELLSADGTEIDEVETIAAARSRLAEVEYGCVVLDLGLPDGTGTDMVASLQTDGVTLPPIIVYTARDLDVVQEQALRRYSSAIIIKGPESPARLLEEVTLFLHRVVAEMPAAQRKALDEIRSRDRVLEGRRILLVEDDVRNVFALTSVLEPKGAVLTIARNGRQALEVLAASEEVELVIMDVMMPEMDGIQATCEIRRQARWARLPIIMVTAKAMPDDRERCLAAGANDFLAKPIDIERLISLLRVWLPR